MARVNLPYGIDNFEKVRESNCYYIDKTGFIKELLDWTFDVNLITRPRRFGKTLTMSMLAEFFDIRKDSRKLFEGLEIAKDTEFCSEWMNQWPVLFLTLKDVDGDSFEDAYGMLQFVISSVCGEHHYLLDSNRVLETDKRIFQRLSEQSGTAWKKNARMRFSRSRRNSIRKNLRLKAIRPCCAMAQRLGERLAL